PLNLAPHPLDGGPLIADPLRENVQMLVQPHDLGYVHDAALALVDLVDHVALALPQALQALFLSGAAHRKTGELQPGAINEIAPIVENALQSELRRAHRLPPGGKA